MRRTLLPMLLLLAACSAPPPDEAGPSPSNESVPAASERLRALLPSLAPGEVVHGWPDTTENQAGVYSWDAAGCGSVCNSGFMHNGYGSGDVEIEIDVLPEGSMPDDGATAVTVAGHAGLHERIDALSERWIVDIEGTTIVIRLTARPGTSQADLSEAHAIIASMRAVADDNRLGFRLLFTLTTNDWDSG